MIIFDTETTNLTAPEAAPIEQQPSITEFAAVKLTEVHSKKKGTKSELEEVTRMEFLCDPRVPIPPEAVKITGITNDMVRGKPPFSAFVPALTDFFLGERMVISHNLAFDISVLRHELNRLGRVTAFPWPPTQVCTVEKTLYMKGHRLNLSALYLELTGKPRKDAHRAMGDVETLVECVKELWKKGIF